MSSRSGRLSVAVAASTATGTALLRATLLTVALASSALAMKGNLVLSSEKMLIKHLLETYEASGIVGRPVNNTNDAIYVEFSMCLIQILDLDEQNQILTVSTWNRYLWHDYLLAWNPEDFGGITSVRVPAYSIWKPDVVLYNYADGRLKELREALATVSSDGSVYWIPPAIYKSSCSIDITSFPFDSQTCHFKFGSWSYDGLKLDIAFLNNSSFIDLGDFVASNEWDIVSHDAVRNVIVYPCCSEPYPDLTFTLVLKRKVAFYSFILVLPCILLSLLVMVLFWIPPDSPAKMQLGINVFVAFFLLLLLLANNTPSGSSSIPLIGVYYCTNMVMITCSTFLAMFIVRLYVRFDRKNTAPRWLVRVVLGRLAKVLLMGNYVPKKSASERVSLRQMRSEPRRPVLMDSADWKAACKNNNGTWMAPDGPLRSPPVAAAAAAAEAIVCCASEPTDRRSDGGVGRVAAPSASPIGVERQVEHDVREICRLLKLTAQKQDGRDETARAIGEWKAIALVLDRLFFIAYVLTLIVTISVIFPKTLS